MKGEKMKSKIEIHLSQLKIEDNLVEHSIYFILVNNNLVGNTIKKQKTHLF
jgi:hypothetical protein